MNLLLRFYDPLSGQVMPLLMPLLLLQLPLLALPLALALIIYTMISPTNLLVAALL